MSRPQAEETILTPEERYIISHFAYNKWAATALTDMICTMKVREREAAAPPVKETTHE